MLRMYAVDDPRNEEGLLADSNKFEIFTLILQRGNLFLLISMMIYSQKYKMISSGRDHLLTT